MNLTPGLIETLLNVLIYTSFSIFVIWAIYICFFKDFDPLANIISVSIVLVLWLVVLFTPAARYLSDNQKSANVVVNNYVNAIKFAPFYSVDNDSIQLNQEITAKINTIEISPNQKKVELTFWRNSKEFRTETVFY